MLPQNLRRQSVSRLELSVRSNNALERAGYDTIGKIEDLFIGRPKTEVLRLLPAFGAKSYREVIGELHRLRGTGETPDDELEFRRWCLEHRAHIDAVRQGRAAIVAVYMEKLG